MTLFDGGYEHKRLDVTVEIRDPSGRSALYGPADRNLRLIRAAFDVRISARNGVVRISGGDVAAQRAAACLNDLQRLLPSHPAITDEMVKEAIGRAESGEASAAGEPLLDVFLPSARVTPRGSGQQAYVEAMNRSDLTICLGPAGTGKTYLAVAVAVSLLKRERIKRIVLVRPAVEAGEKLGFLPGDMQAKINPYLRPLFDAMHDMMGFEQIKRFMQNDVIEVVPMAFMRGRTLNNAAVILDEAQNSTVQQMLMFLTRLGHDSKMVVTGDDSQSDLDGGRESGLTDALRRLGDVPEVSIVRLTKRDIVRHPLVQTIVEAYEDRGEEVR